MQGNSLSTASQNSNGAAPRQQADSALAGASSWTGAEPELDLDRLVWDPEYRQTMRQAIKCGF